MLSTPHQSDNGPIRILGIGGSTRRASKSRAALSAALAIAAGLGAATTLANLGELDLPLFNSDLARADHPPSVDWLIAEARRADAYILCSPTYHGTISGAVKNALDLLDLMADGPDGAPDQTFAGKVVGLLATGGGAANVLTALYHSARALDGLVVPTVVSIGNAAIDADQNRITEPGPQRRLEAMVKEVVDLATRLRR